MRGVIRVGELAPDFTLPGTGGRDYTLSSYRGQTVVLAFYPGDDTRVCTVQLNQYNDNLSAFADLGVQLLGLSPQSVDSHEAFAGKYDFQFPLLADTDKEVGGRYGILGPLGFYRRSVFVVGPDGIVRYAHRSVTGATFRSTDELLEAIRG
ncbi:MAG: peroxiredoxin [Acidobacteria bacterium]|nr:peroxiredoxin [Acidobacteriota bacterium]